MNGHREGFALLVTFWFMVGIAAVGLEWGLRGRDQRRVVLYVAEAATARRAAESALARARALLHDAASTGPGLSGSHEADRLLDPWRHTADLMPDSGRDGVAAWRLLVEDAGNRLNLNRAEAEDLRRLLLALRVDAGRADRIAQAVADWRDPDHEHRPRGAERDWYEGNGSTVLPRNAPFASLDELRHVRGVTPEIYARLETLLSLHGSGRVNLMTAPRPVLLTLPGFGEEAVRVLEGMRAIEGTASLFALGDRLTAEPAAVFFENLPRLTARVTTRTEELHVTSEGFVPGGTARVRLEALLVRHGDATFVSRLELTR